MVKDGYELLHKHLHYATGHDLIQENAAVFPTGEPNLEPLTRSVLGVLPVGARSTGAANDFVNSKTAFVVYKPTPLPANASTRRAFDFFVPTLNGGDSLRPHDTSVYSTAATGQYQFNVNNPGNNTTSQVVRSRGVFTHVSFAYQGPLQTATGSLYLAIPPQGLYSYLQTSEVVSFNSIFGENDTTLLGVDNTNLHTKKPKTAIITLAKLAEVGSISFVIYNELETDYILKECRDLPDDTLYEHVGTQPPSSFAVLMGWCDSTTLSDRVRIHVSHHFDIEYNTIGSYSDARNGTRAHVPPNHLNVIPEIINSANTVIPSHPGGSVQRQAHAAQVWASMARGQTMDIGTLSTEEEMDVGHPSFGSVKKAVKAAWNTEQTDNEYYGAVVAGQPEVAAYAAPVVEPAIAAHAVYNFFRTNK